MVSPAKPMKMQPYYVKTKSTFQSSKIPRNQIPRLAWTTHNIEKNSILEGEGLLVAVNNFLMYEELDCSQDGTLEAQSIKIKPNSQSPNLKFLLSPRRSYPNDCKPYLTRFLTEDNSLPPGDVNAHSSLWNSHFSGVHQGSNFHWWNYQLNFYPTKRWNFFVFAGRIFSISFASTVFELANF